jgi:hypothetical protein
LRINRAAVRVPNAGDTIEGPPLLDSASKLAAPWLVTWYPELGEGSVTYTKEASTSTDEPRASDPERNRLRNAQRALTAARRYSVRNQLVYRWTLTLAAATDESTSEYRTVRSLVNAFVKRLRRRHGDFAWLQSIEWHPGGHGWHVNLLIGFRIEHDVMTDLWGHGHVFVTGPRRGVGLRASARGHVMYALKHAFYALKSDDRPEAGLHRYERSQGFNVRKVRISVVSQLAGERVLIAENAGELPVYRKDSRDIDNWRGPPTVLLSWN